MCWLQLDKDSLGLMKPVLPEHVLVGAAKHRFSSIGFLKKGHFFTFFFFFFLFIMKV